MHVLFIVGSRTTRLWRLVFVDVIQSPSSFRVWFLSSFSLASEAKRIGQRKNQVVLFSVEQKKRFLGSARLISEIPPSFIANLDVARVYGEKIPSKIWHPFSENCEDRNLVPALVRMAR